MFVVKINTLSYYSKTCTCIIKDHALKTSHCSLKWKRWRWWLISSTRNSSSACSVCCPWPLSSSSPCLGYSSSGCWRDATSEWFSETWSLGYNRRWSTHRWRDATAGKDPPKSTTDPTSCGASLTKAPQHCWAINPRGIHKLLITCDRHVILVFF